MLNSIEIQEKTSRFLDLNSFSTNDEDTNQEMLHWFSILKSLSAFEMFNRTSRSFSKKDICEYLILNAQFPRSIHHCMSQINWAMRFITGSPDGIFENESERNIGKLLAELQFKEIDNVLDEGLHEYLDYLQTSINSIGSSIEKRYF